LDSGDTLERTTVVRRHNQSLAAGVHGDMHVVHADRGACESPVGANVTIMALAAVLEHVQAGGEIPNHPEVLFRFGTFLNTVEYILYL
jgi:hypothetical protein